MAFYPDPQVIVATEEGRKIAAWVYRQLNRLSGGQFQVNHLVFAELHVEPDKPTAGMMAFADGTDWNPGSGRGPYFYTTTWVFLG